MRRCIDQQEDQPEVCTSRCQVALSMFFSQDSQSGVREEVCEYEEELSDERQKNPPSRLTEKGSKEKDFMK